MHTVFTKNEGTSKRKRVNGIVLALLLKYAYGLDSTHKGNIDKYCKPGEHHDIST